MLSAFFQVAGRLAGLMLIVTLVDVPAALRAQELPELATAPQYEVEIIVLRNLDQHANTPEVAKSVAADAGQTDSVASDAFTSVTPGTTAGGAGWPELASASLRLTGIAERLRRPGAYQLLYHGGWTQPVERQNRAAPTPLPTAALRAGVSGALTLYRERYLHVLVDISLEAAGLADDEQNRIRQGRRLRGQAAQYFDHPQFGVILAVRPLGNDTVMESPAGVRSPDETVDP